MRPTRTATEREKAIIFALAAGFITDWKTAFILSRPYPEDDPKTQNFDKSSVTHWKQHPAIVKAYENALDILQVQKTRLIDETRREIQTQEEKTTTPADSERTNNTKRNPVDYYDPKNQRTQINKIIAESQDDPKTQLDAIKAIQQTQRDDRQAAKDNQIQRFYTPVNCHICPLYLKKRQK